MQLTCKVIKTFSSEIDFSVSNTRKQKSICLSGKTVNEITNITCFGWFITLNFHNVESADLLDSNSPFWINSTLKVSYYLYKVYETQISQIFNLRGNTPCGNFVMALARPQLGYRGRIKPQMRRLTRPKPTSWPSLVPTWHRSFCESQPY